MSYKVWLKKIMNKIDIDVEVFENKDDQSDKVESSNFFALEQDLNHLAVWFEALFRKDYPAHQSMTAEEYIQLIVRKVFKNLNFTVI